MINIFNHEKIILGDPFNNAREYHLPTIKETVTLHTLFEFDQRAQVLLSSFGPDARLIGGIAVVAGEVLSKLMNL